MWWGGEEFVVPLNYANHATAKACDQRMRADLAEVTMRRIFSYGMLKQPDNL
jgi:GGDEF domain-containing protein